MSMKKKLIESDMIGHGIQKELVVELALLYLLTLFTHLTWNWLFNCLFVLVFVVTQ